MWPMLFMVGMVALSWLQIRPSMAKRPKRHVLSTRVRNGEIVEVYEIWTRR